MPVYCHGIFYFLEYSSAGSWKVSAEDKSTGRELWNVAGTGQINSILGVSDNLVLVPSSTLVALDRSTGKKLWEASGTNYSYGYPVVQGDLVFALSGVLRERTWEQYLKEQAKEVEVGQ